MSATLLDTNVLSELLRERPAPEVLNWYSAQPPRSLFVSAITQAEMMLGAAVLPAGKRRTALEGALRAMFEQDFLGQVLAFDPQAAARYAPIVAARRAQGRPISQFDAQIAAIAASHGTRLAARNLADFEGVGISLVDPWASGAGV